MRNATRAAHERLHHLPAFAALAAGTIGPAAYVALLARLLGFHTPVEAALARALAAAPYGIVPRSWQRAGLLRRDLAQLGLDAEALDRLPAMPVPPEMTTAAALGCLYVVEGSTLGGRQLARQLDHILPAGGAGRMFLQGGTQPGHLRWSALCAALDECGADPGRLAGMTSSAVSTFAQFEGWFTGLGRNLTG